MIMMNNVMMMRIIVMMMIIIIAMIMIIITMMMTMIIIISEEAPLGTVHVARDAAVKTEQGEKIFNTVEGQYFFDIFNIGS